MNGAGIAVLEPDELPDLRSQWEQLWTQVPDANPFQSPGWLLPWAEVYAPGRCRAAALWRDSGLAALVPAFVWEGSLLLAGSGPSDHSAALFAPGAESAATALIQVLVQTSPEPFDCIDLQQLAPDSPLRSLELDGFEAVEETGEPCLLLPLHDEAGMGQVPKRMRSNWRYAVRRFEREGAHVEAVAWEKVAQAAAELERLHSLRWRAEGEDGVLADELAARRLGLAIPELARAALLRMLRLTRGGQTIAILFAIRGKQSTCYYLSGFDPEWASLSPGTVLVGAAIERAASEGCALFDFLRGQEEYKYKWGAEDRPRVRRVLTRL